jgi:dimethylaniline monooxygenase (N-oxide forming)
VLPNYLSGFTIDLFSNRFMLYLPAKAQSLILEALIGFVSGRPEKYGIKPKLGCLQAHPTVSPTLLHHCQRKNVLIKPNIKVLISCSCLIKIYGEFN